MNTKRFAEFMEVKPATIKRHLKKHGHYHGHFPMKVEGELKWVMSGYGAINEQRLNELEAEFATLRDEFEESQKKYKGQIWFLHKRIEKLEAKL